MGFMKTKFISDNWHLFHQVLPKNLGPFLAERLSPFVREMANSRSEKEFNENFKRCKDELTKGNTVKQIHVNFLDDLYEERETFALYSVAKIQSSRGRIGSTSSEANHSSLVIHLNGERGVNKYIERPLTLIKDALERQASHIKKWNIDLFNEDREMMTRIHTLNNPYDIDLKNAAMKLCKRSFDRFVKNRAIAKRDFSLQGGNQVRYVHNQSYPPRVFSKETNDKFNRCACKGRLAYEEQCVHELVLYGFEFREELFEQWHFRRTKVTSSPIPSCFRVNEEFDENSGTILMESLSDDENDAALDNHETEFINEDSIIPYGNDEAIVPYPNRSIPKVTLNDFKQAHQELYSNLRNCDDEITTKLFALTLESTEIAKYNGKVETTLAQEGTGVNCLEDLVRNYKMSFRLSKNSFLSSSSRRRNNEPGYDVQRRRPRLRLQSRREMSLNRVRTKKPKTCSFCSSADHQVTICPVKEKLCLESTMHVLHIGSSNTLLSEDTINSISRNANLIKAEKTNGIIRALDRRQSSKHIIVRAAFYNNDWLGTQSHLWKDKKTYAITNMIFGVSFINEFGEADDNITLVSGKGLEQYIYTAGSGRKKTYLFDQTYMTRTSGELIRDGNPMLTSYIENPMKGKPMLYSSEDELFHDTLDDMSI